MDWKHAALAYCNYRIAIGAAVLLIFTVLYLNGKTTSESSRVPLAAVWILIAFAVALFFLRENPVVCGLTIGSDALSLF